MDSNNTLVHYGIKGMKWGVRRTEAQLARARGKKEPSADAKEKADRKNAVKNRRTMSTQEIQKRIERLKLEKQLKDLTADDLSPGRKFVSDVLKTGGGRVAGMAVAGAAAYAVKVAMTKHFDIKEAASYIAANPNKKK